MVVIIVLHAGARPCAGEALDSRLLIWGEQSVKDKSGAAETSTQTKSKSDNVPPTAHPFAVDLQSIATIFQSAVGRRRSELGARKMLAWLPSGRGSPIPSSSVIGEIRTSGANIELMPWAIDAIPLTPAEAVDLLCACAGKHMLAPGVAVGHDLAFWVQSLRFAGAMVVRQQYVPSLQSGNGQHRAQWHPVFSDVNLSHLADLARRMPLAARCLSSPEETIPPSIPALQTLKQITEDFLDYLVRSAAVNHRNYRSGDADSGNVHDLWLNALRSPDGNMNGDPSELERLASQVREWQRPVMLAASPFRLCFRLEEPEGEQALPGDRVARPTHTQVAGLDTTHHSQSQWYMRYLLQSVTDPSLVVPVQDIWGARGHRTAVPALAGFNAREYVLSSLGQCAGICDRIAASLRSAQPGGYELDLAGAHEFLTAKATALEQAGFGVMLPAWWTQRGTRPRLSVRARVKDSRMDGSGMLSLDAVLDVDWDIALGDQTLSLQELRALAALKAPLVKMRGQWVQVSSDEIKAALTFWKRKAGSRITVRDAVRTALGTEQSLNGLSVGGIEASGWLNEMLARLEGTEPFEERPAPAGFRGTLRPYQARGYSWLWCLRRYGLGACLADDMGLGKTVQTLALIAADWDQSGNGDHRRPVLLVCPTSVVSNWRREAERFVPSLPVMVHHGADRAKGREFVEAVSNSALVISSYSLLPRDLEQLAKVDWAGIVLDEAQNIKNSETKQARAAQGLKAEYRIALTGTPVENNVGDLWSIMQFLNPGLLGSREQFKREFFVPIQASDDRDAAERLRRTTSPFVLRRLKTDKTVIADLPDKIESKVFCTLTREQASLYTAVLREAEETLEGLDGIERKGVILATLSKIKQICNHPAQFLRDHSAITGRSGKLTRLLEMLDEVLAVRDRALVFTQFAEMGEILRRHLQETFGHEVLFLHGGVSRKQRDQMVERFQSEDHDGSIFILSLKAGGTGLNLTRANHVFHFDRWWNPAVENQATDRAFRIGQTRNVQVHKFVCSGTLEEKIDQMIEQKRSIAEEVIGTGEGWLTSLSNQGLRQILALRSEAVEE